MGETLELTLDTEGRRALLRFEYPSEVSGPSGPLIDGMIRVVQGPLRLEYSFLCFGFDLDEFARELGRLHASMDGEARFLNQEGNVEVRFAVASRGRGRMEVVIGLEQQDTTWIGLRGFAVEQSYLPGLTEAIERFLVTTSVDRVHPMLRLRRRT